MGVSGLWASVAVALLAVAYLVVSGAGVASANEPDDPIDLGFPLNIAQQVYLEPALFSDVATKYPSDGSGYVISYQLNGEPYPAPNPENPLVGRGPHGYYDTATFKCQTCHSPHAAQMPLAEGDLGGSKLLRAGSTGCEYCHVGSSIASNKRVYQASDDPSNLGADNSGHQLGLKASVPNSTLTDFTLTCGSCHSVHGATQDLWKPTDFFQPADQDPSDDPIDDATQVVGYKLLKKNPSGLGDGALEFREIESSPTTDPLTINQFAFSAWCTTCHDVNTSGNIGYLGLSSEEATSFTRESHMTPHADGEFAVGYPGPRPDPIEGLYSGPNQCFTCHRGGLTPVPVGLDSTDATQAALLGRIEGTGYPYVQNKDLDALDLACSRCHYGTADFAADLNRLNGTADWPHSSTNDHALLGSWTLDSTQYHAGDADQLQIPGGKMTEENWPRYLCGRCHITEDGLLFSRSRYAEMHIDLTAYTNLSTETSGLLGTFFSPGVVGTEP